MACFMAAGVATPRFGILGWGDDVMATLVHLFQDSLWVRVEPKRRHGLRLHSGHVPLRVLSTVRHHRKRRVRHRAGAVALTPSRLDAGRPRCIPTKPHHRGNLVGGAMFGVGWSITGMCPGPVLVNLGEGKLYAWAALAGVLVGTALFGILYPKLVPSMGLAPLSPVEKQEAA